MKFKYLILSLLLITQYGNITFAKKLVYEFRNDSLIQRIELIFKNKTYYNNKKLKFVYTVKNTKNNISEEIRGILIKRKSYLDNMETLDDDLSGESALASDYDLFPKNKKFYFSVRLGTTEITHQEIAYVSAKFRDNKSYNIYCPIESLGIMRIVYK